MLLLRIAACFPLTEIDLSVLDRVESVFEVTGLIITLNCVCGTGEIEEVDN
jgi:hypothetical protein